MRILFLTQTVDEEHPVLGVVPDWIRALAARLERIDVLALHSIGAFDPPANVRLRSLGKSRGAPPLRGLSRLVVAGRFVASVLPLVAARRVDLVFAHMIPLYAVLAALLARPFGIPTVLWYAHGSIDRWLPMAWSLVDRVATASAESFRLPAARADILGHGIPCRRFAPPAGSPPAISAPILLAPGRIGPIKDIETVLDATAILARSIADLRLHVVGSPALPEDEAYLELLRARARALGIAPRVVFAGAVPYARIGSSYRSASWVASASRTGSLDKNGLEAMAAERPFFSSNEAFLPVWREEAEHFAFRQGRPEDLAERILAFEALAPAQRESILEKLARRVAEEHDVDRLSGRLADLFESLRR